MSVDRIDVSVERETDNRGDCLTGLWAAVFNLALSDFREEVFCEHTRVVRNRLYREIRRAERRGESEEIVKAMRRDRAKAINQLRRDFDAGLLGKLPLAALDKILTWNWMDSRHRGLGSFAGCCVLFDLEPSAVRARLKAMYFK